MLKEKDLDIVLIATPDHWHPLAMIAAVEAGADVYVEKPISVDVAEAQAMLAAAPSIGGSSRWAPGRSTPHLIEARDRIVREGKLGKVGLVEIYCYYHMRAQGNPPDTNPPDYLDWEMWTGPAPMRPYNPIVHPRGWAHSWSTATGSWGTCASTCSTWSDGCSAWDGPADQLDGWHPGRQSQQGEHPRHADVTFDFGDLTVKWQHRTWGAPADPTYPWGATFYGDKGTLKESVFGYDFIPMGGGTPIHRDVTYELEQYPEDKTEKDLEKHIAPATRGHMKDFLAAIASRDSGGRHRRRLHLHDELPPGQPVAATRQVIDLGPAGRQSPRR